MIVKDNNFKQLSAQNATFSNINTQSLTVNGIPFDSTNTTSEILTSSGIIPLTNTSTFFETYKSYSLDGSQLPKFILSSGISNQQINLNLLNPRSGNVNVKTNKGSFNLTFDNQNVDLQYINTNWVQKGTKSPWFVNASQARLVGTEFLGTPNQGWSCNLSADGNTLAIGGPSDNTSDGATWIFTRSGNTWSQQDKLIGSSGISAFQGISCSLSADGNTLAVGGNAAGSNYGAAWIFIRSGNPPIWTEQAKLVGSSGISSQQGISCSLSADGNTLAVGGYGDNSNYGATWIFTRSNSVWTQQGNKLVGSSGSTSRQGTSCSLSADGNTLSVGGPTVGGNTGATWIFTRSGNPSGWTEQSKLIGSNGTNSRQGTSCSLSSDGNTLAVGGYTADSNYGATWIFTRSGNTWSQQTKLIGSNGTGSRQGYSCSLSSDGNTLAVGGFASNSNYGATWIFTRTGNPAVWTQQNKLIGSNGTGSSQGYSCSLSADGNTLAVGGIDADTEFGSNFGATWVFI